MSRAACGRIGQGGQGEVCLPGLPVFVLVIMKAKKFGIKQKGKLKFGCVVGVFGHALNIGHHCVDILAWTWCGQGSVS